MYILKQLSSKYFSNNFQMIQVIIDRSKKKNKQNKATTNQSDTEKESCVEKVRAAVI